MNIVGVIGEYNPFHNGHLYHINKIKEMYPDCLIILVMSGSVTERGDISILTKWEKTEIVLNYGIDLVIELPFSHASQSADLFCEGSIKLLKELKVDTLVFGSECNNTQTLTKLANIQLYNEEYKSLVKDYISNGYNYPTALSKALFKISNIKIDTPNDILGISYIREILKQKAHINPVSIKRTNQYHSHQLDSEISSATSIREAIQKKIPISNYVPEYSYAFLQKKVYFIDDYFPFLKYKILSSINQLDKYQTVDISIIPRIKKEIIDANSLDELINKVKSKNDTYSKLKRMFTHILVDFTKEDAKKYKKIKYIRLLGFNNKGRAYLNKIKKEISLPILTNYSNDKDRLLSLEFKVTSILSILQGRQLIEQEYKQKPIIRN